MDSASVVALARERAGLTLRQLAERASTSHSTLAAYEAGRVTPSVSTLDRIVRAAGFALTAGLTGSVDDPGRDEELQSVLELAAQFPARHDRDLRMPPFRSTHTNAAPRSLRPTMPGEWGGTSMISLTDKIILISEALDDAGLPHAFGGALALAWCTQRARGTIDIDVNVFASAARTAEVLAALPHDLAHDSDDEQRCLDTGQVRLWLGSTPVDVFLNTTPRRRTAGHAARVRRPARSPSSVAPTSLCSRRSSTARRTGPTSRK